LFNEPGDLIEIKHLRPRSWKRRWDSSNEQRVIALGLIGVSTASFAMA